jgi:hypothetical protein
MYAHLARDPYPATLMKMRAPNVFRWTERMNLANIADAEFPDCAQTYFADDGIPATLEPVLALLFRDWGNQLKADAALFNRWISSNPALPAGHLVNVDSQRTVHPSLGMVESELRGCKVSRASAPHGLWHFAKAQAAAARLDDSARAQFADLIRQAKGEQVMAIRLARAMKREDYVLVLS